MLDWDAVETSIIEYAQAQWALTEFAATFPLLFENEDQPMDSNSYIQFNIDGLYTDKSRYGSRGKILAVDAGIVFYHAFALRGAGKLILLRPIVAMSNILQLITINSVIDMEGANPPSPVESGTDQDFSMPNQQPGGTYFRCSASVPFVVRGAV